MNTFLHILSFIGSLGLFLYGMKIMSEGLEKLAGDKMRNVLGAMTRNRFMGVLTGVGVTALIQSSSATTVMVVSFVNAISALPLRHGSSRLSVSKSASRRCRCRCWQ